MSAVRKRLAAALLLSLLMHVLLASLAFNGDGRSLLRFRFFWQDRPIEVADLRVVLAPAPVNSVESVKLPATPVAEPLQQASIKSPIAREAVPAPSGSDAPISRPFVAPTVAPIIPEAPLTTDPTIATDATHTTNAATSTSTPVATLRADRSADAAIPQIPAPAVIAIERTDKETRVVPSAVPALAPMPNASSAESAIFSPRDAGDAARVRSEREPPQRVAEPANPGPSKQEEQRQPNQLIAAPADAAVQGVVRAENARLEAERQEAARQATARQEAARQQAATEEAGREDATRSETTRVEAVRVEAARVEAVRVEAVRAEAARVEAARVEAVRIEAARVEAARVEAARVDGDRVDAARAAAIRAEAAHAEAARAEAAEAAQKREARLRAIGRQLDEEADKRDAAKAAAHLLPSSSAIRRYKLLGRTDPNKEIIEYAESWARKIHQNMTIDMVRDAAKQPHTNPLVTVAIRRDGSVESVKIELSSGVPAIDEAILRIVHSQAPYQAFPPGLARELDVLEIRRTWYFDVAIRLY